MKLNTTNKLSIASLFISALYIVIIAIVMMVFSANANANPNKEGCANWNNNGGYCMEMSPNLSYEQLRAHNKELIKAQMEVNAMYDVMLEIQFERDMLRAEQRVAERIKRVKERLAAEEAAQWN